MWRLEKTGKLGTADEKISELFALLAESRAYQESETRWAQQYKDERDACMDDLRRLLAKHEATQSPREIIATITYSDGRQKQCYKP